MLLRVLLLADTHLGFDLPLRPRVERVRRGPDFFANTRRALEPARAREVDVVVHGGDLLYRSKVPPRLVEMALEPLLEVADCGVPVVLVPGNHERSALPYPLLAAHRHLHVMERPQTIEFELAGLRVAVAGFPCERHGVRDRFGELVRQTGVRARAADIRLLCLHQTVEGAAVGPGNFVFRGGAEVIRGRDLPVGLAAVLAGHIHRAQVLERDLEARPLAAPVVYPGSIERTSAAERDEAKGFALLELQGNERGGRLVRRRFHRLPARPMVDVRVEVAGLDAQGLAAELGKALAPLDPRAVVRIEVAGEVSEEARPVLHAASLRALAPPEMIVELRRPRGGWGGRKNV